METPTNLALPFEAFIFVTSELVRVPVITLVKFIQVSLNPPLKDALGNDMPPHVEVQEFTKDDLKNHKTMKPLQGRVMCTWKVYGQIPKPMLPNFEHFGMYLKEFNGHRDIPVKIILAKLNLDTFDFEAISEGPPLVEVTQNDPAKKSNMLH